MKILLLGEYSNVHATLAKGLRHIGHEVTVISNGDFWKDYPRDIDVSRKSGKLGGILLYAKLISLLPRMRGYDVVQLINPIFFELKADHLFYFYDYLRKNNKRIFLGAFGMDWYWVNTCTYEKPLRYSDFNIGNKIRNNDDAVKEKKDWIGTQKEKLNKYIANTCDGIITGLYEYHVCYEPKFPSKTTFIPYPIIPDNTQTNHEVPNKLKVFIGISRGRHEYKGTDIMLKAAEDVAIEYPELIEIVKAEGIPYNEYIQLMKGCHAILDQLYSYTPSMNPLQAMSYGIICIGGGEPENYDILNENNLRPIVNVLPTYESVYNELVKLITNLDTIPLLQSESIEYINKHHDYIKVAKEYESAYTTKGRI